MLPDSAKDGGLIQTLATGMKLYENILQKGNTGGATPSNQEAPCPYRGPVPSFKSQMHDEEPRRLRPDEPDVRHPGPLHGAHDLHQEGLHDRVPRAGTLAVATR